MSAQEQYQQNDASSLYVSSQYACRPKRDDDEAGNSGAMEGGVEGEGEDARRMEEGPGRGRCLKVKEERVNEKRRRKPRRNEDDGRIVIAGKESMSHFMVLYCISSEVLTS